MLDRVKECIDRLTPAFGVNIVELVDVQDGVVKVRLFPSVCSVGIASDTMLELVREQIQDEIPEIRDIEVVE